MSTLIKSGTLWFSDYHSRFLTAMEALTCQGFPVHQQWSHMQPCCSFAMRTAGLCDTPGPGRGATIGQAGNSMHTEVAASILSYALLEIKLEKCARHLFHHGMIEHIPRPMSMPSNSTDCRKSESLRLPQKRET